MVIKTCQYCGAVHSEPVDTCCFCDAPLGNSSPSAISRVVATRTEGALAVEPEWRREVSNRLHAYRARRRGGAAANLQSALPFEPATGPSVEDMDIASVAVPPASAPAPRQRQSRGQSRAERVEISIPKYELASAAVGIYRQGTGNPGAAPDVLFPVASLAERRRAAMLDGALLLFSFGGMLALFWALGGRISFNKLDAIVTVATLGLFYAQYFALFTVFGGSTPGMMLRGLRVISFDGSIPTSRQMIWRSFGYLVSAGTCLLGFFWALWDEDLLCWHDRISQTYLTRIEDVAGN